MAFYTSGVTNFIREFRAFIIKGNAIELAVGVVIGVAFNAVVNSLVKDIILGAIANIFTQPDFSAFAWGAVKWGNFVNNVVNLFVVGFSVFVVVKAFNKITGARIGQPTVTSEKK